MSFCLLQTSLITEAVVNMPAVLRDWRQDTLEFLRHDVPKIVLVVIGAYVLIRVLRAVARKSAELQIRKLPPGVRVQQVRTVASVLTSICVFVISFIAMLMVLGQLGLNLGPMLASAGIAGLAIGFGARRHRVGHRQSADPGSYRHALCGHGVHRSVEVPNHRQAHSRGLVDGPQGWRNPA